MVQNFEILCYSSSVSVSKLWPWRIWSLQRRGYEDFCLCAFCWKSTGILEEKLPPFSRSKHNNKKNMKQVTTRMTCSTESSVCFQYFIWLYLQEDRTLLKSWRLLSSSWGFGYDELSIKTFMQCSNILRIHTQGLCLQKYFLGRYEVFYKLPRTIHFVERGPSPGSIVCM